MRATVIEYAIACIVLVLLIGALSGCSPTPPVVKVPVVQGCVTPAQIAPEPGHVALTGDARHDASTLASADLRLRAWGRELRALLVGCGETGVASPA